MTLGLPAKEIERENRPSASVRTDVPAEAPSMTSIVQPSHNRPVTYRTEPVTTNVITGGGGSVRDGSTGVLSPQAPARATDSVATDDELDLQSNDILSRAWQVIASNLAELSFRPRFRSDRFYCDECGNEVRKGVMTSSTQDVIELLRWRR